MQLQGCGRREYHHRSENEPQGQASLRRQSATEQAAVVRPVEPVSVHRTHRTRDGAAGRSPILEDRLRRRRGDLVKHPRMRRLQVRTSFLVSVTHLHWVTPLRFSGASGCAGPGLLRLRVEPLRASRSFGLPSLAQYGQAGCAGVHTTAARSRARGSRALDSFMLRVNDEPA